MAESEQPLQLYEVGHYSDLTARPNPAGYVVLNVPDFDAMVQLIEQERGYRLTPEEIEAKRKEAPCIVLLKDEAAKMIASRIPLT
jgi:hypothetical protein